MKSSNLSFSLDENRVDYHYVPQNFLNSSFMERLDYCQMYEKSLSSSFLAMPQLNHLSLNSSFSYSKQREKQENRRSQKGSFKQETKIQNLKIEFQPSSIDDLQLDFLVSNKKLSTKNVLRNFGNAQNQYILHNQSAQEYLLSVLDNKNQFQSWIRKLKLLNFEDYKLVWGPVQNDSQTIKLYKKIYKRLCWNFYKQECIPYIFNGRLTANNKKSHLLQIHKMLSGILNSESFEGFKQ